jgi:RimJ/RimL family protein N-acetyltransferase
MNLRIETPRLELIAADLALVRADLHHREDLARRLDARLEDWPPPLYEVSSMQWTINRLTEDPARVGWMGWYWVRRAPHRVAIGMGGFKGRPEAGAVEIGYSVVPKFQCHGLATEAVTALVEWAFEHVNVVRVVAETLPELIPSQRVLTKSGFTYVGEGSEPGVLRYERRRLSPLPLAESHLPLPP